MCSGLTVPIRRRCTTITPSSITLVWNVLKETVGEEEAVLFARSASVGAQQFPVHWGGDCYANYESMAESLRGGLSIGLSGFGFWSQ